MKVVAIVQARMGSSRLPGKVLRPLAGKPLLWHIVHRLRKCIHVDEIVIATSDKPTDEPLVEFGQTEKVRVVRGPEDNVLERFWIAAQESNADVIVRVTGDAPLIDPETIDRLIKKLIETRADYCTGAHGVPCIHEGFCPFSRKALERLVTEAGDDPVAREHVTAYFKQHPDDFEIQEIDIPGEYQVEGVRLSVDTPADLEFLEALYQKLGAAPGEADMQEAVKILSDNPSLIDLNRHVKQKDADETSRMVLIRCDGGHRIGLGHIVRCIALADELRDRHGVGVTFAVQEDQRAIEYLVASGYPVKLCPPDMEEADWLADLARERKPDMLVLDIRTDLSRESVEQIRRSGLLITVIDDPSDRRLAADLAFYPPVPQVEQVSWDGFTGKLHCGWEWILLRRQFADRHQRLVQEPATEKRPPDIPRVLITMGGSDPAGLTLKAVRALELIEDKFHPVIALGSGYRDHDKLEAVLDGARREYDIQEDVKDMAGLMASADLAVASLSVTAYELVCMGVPGIYLSLTGDHAKSATAFQEGGFGISLGVYTNVLETNLVSAVSKLLHDMPARHAMARRCLAVADGSGAARIAEILLGKIFGTTHPSSALKCSINSRG